MPILLGVVASVLIGVSDTFGRASAKRADAVSHVTMQMGIGFVVALPVALGFGHEVITRDLVSGALSGLTISVGLAIVYHAMAAASSAIAAPTAAVMAALVPLAWDVVGGARLTGTAGIGCAVAVVALALTTFDPELGDRLQQGLLMAIVGGTLFGIAVVLSADTSEASGAWPAVSQRSAGFVAMAVLARQRGVPTILPPGMRHLGFFGGLAGGFGMIAWIIGSQQGDLGTVSIVASTYPAVIAVLTTVFDDDRLRWWQAVGIAGAIGGTALIALGS